MRVLKTLVPILMILVAFNLNAQEESKDKVYKIVEEMPEFPGGPNGLKEFISKNVKYPAIAKEKGIEGRVYITFVVGKDGKVTDAKVIRGIDPSLDKEALRVMNLLPRWQPGKQEGKPVKVAYTVPVHYALSKKKKNTSSEVEIVPVKKDDACKDKVYTDVDEMPEYPGGEQELFQFISKNVEYPVEAQEKGISGKVYVSFVVNKDGSTSNIKVERGVDPSLDKEALRVMNMMPKWIPGKNNGKKVRVSFTVPISFMLK